MGQTLYGKPIGIYGGWNIFTYVRSNPLQWTDSLWLEQWSGWKDPWRPGNTDLGIGVGK